MSKDSNGLEGIIFSITNSVDDFYRLSVDATVVHVSEDPEQVNIRHSDL